MARARENERGPAIQVRRALGKGNGRKVASRVLGIIVGESRVREGVGNFNVQAPDVVHRIHEPHKVNDREVGDVQAGNFLSRRNRRIAGRAFVVHEGVSVGGIDLIEADAGNGIGKIPRDRN